MYNNTELATFDHGLNEPIMILQLILFGSLDIHDEIQTYPKNYGVIN